MRRDKGVRTTIPAKDGKRAGDLLDRDFTAAAPNRTWVTDRYPATLDPMRCFVAALPPEEAINDLDEFLAPRRDSAPFRWTQADQVHLTLAFLGDMEAYRLDELTERLARAAARRRPVTTRIAGGGAFPHVAGARVLWAGLDLDSDDDRTHVRRMAEGARAAANRTGIAVDGQRFRPHLTVARCTRPTELTRWVQLLDAYRGPDWTIDTLTLVESHLGEGPRGRPRYERIAEFEIGA